MAKRKTVDIRKIVQIANGILSQRGGTAESRYTVITMLDSILLEAGQYKGYRYLTPMEVHPEDEPGIFPSRDADKMFSGTDCTRRAYCGEF
jgi:hypothetical protein